MLIVLPFNSKDADLMRRNLAWIVDLGFEEWPEVVLSYDGTVTDEMLAPIAALADRSKRVHHCKYPDPFDKKWPAAPNVAWQQTAAFIARMDGDEPWLWNEADATPLGLGWFEVLKDEYYIARMPFMGHLVAMGGKTHMNGVAIYPKMACEYSINAMRCREAPWDMILSEDVGPAIHDASKLMAHYPRHTGITMSVYDTAVVKRLKGSGAVMFHGCNDGSLIELLRGETIRYNHNGAIVKELTLRDLDSSFDEAEAMWQQEAVRVQTFGAKLIQWRDCRRPVASVLDQTDWDCGFFGDLEHTTKCVHFNPGLVRSGIDNQLWLLPRRWDRLSEEGQWASTIAAHKVDEDMTVERDGLDLDFKCSPIIQMEDARVIWHNGHFVMSHVFWERHRPFGGKQALSSFTPDWKLLETALPPLGRNVHDEDTVEKRIEKNWVWFDYEGEWHFVYSFSPQHTVFKMSNPLPIKSKSNASLWDYGEIRGGTPPVKVGDEYFTFFHSSIPWKKRQKRYYVGAYAFEAQPPFAVTAITKAPLFIGSEDDERIIGGPPCVFPCGALFDGFNQNEWLVTFGCNDERCGWMKIPINDLLRQMTKVR